MREDFISRLVSPDSGLPLSLSDPKYKNDHIISGTLSDNTGNTYPIEQGIPRLLPKQLLAEQVSEMQARDAQVVNYDKMAFLKLFGKIEIPLTKRALGGKLSDNVLEAGCGTGRMTGNLTTIASRLTSIDFSFESLLVNQKKLNESGRTEVTLIQADLCNLPFCTEAFDRVVSCQVLEHVPGQAARNKAIAELSRVLKNKGTLAISAYKHSLLTRLFAQKEGEHAGGIPFFRFTQQEFKNALSEHVHVHGVTGVLVYLYLAKCQKP